MICFSKLGSHDGLEPLNLVSLGGYDQIEQGLSSSREGQRQCAAESAIVLSNDEVRREQYRRNIEVDEMTSGRRYRVGCRSVHVLLLRKSRIRLPRPRIDEWRFGLRSQLSVSFRSPTGRVGIRETTSLTGVQITVRILSAKGHFSDIVLFT